MNNGRTFFETVTGGVEPCEGKRCGRSVDSRGSWPPLLKSKTEATFHKSKSKVGVLGSLDHFPGYPDE